ncbi:hypothetical protein CR956_01535, partial [Candidatus Saccharibacteria bacterium]
MDFIKILAAKLKPGQIGVQTIDANKTLFEILNTIYFLGGAIAVLIIVIGGYIFVTSGGNPENIKRAKG